MSAKMRDRVAAIKVAPSGSLVASPLDIAHTAPAAEPVSPAIAAAKIFDFKDFTASELRDSTAMGYNGQQ
jgi:hypothetical protein